MDYEAASKALTALASTTVNPTTVANRIAAYQAEALVDLAASVRAIVGIMMSDGDGLDPADVGEDEDTPEDGYEPSAPGSGEVAIPGDWVAFVKGDGLGLLTLDRVVATGFDQRTKWLELASMPGVKTWASEWAIVDEPEGLDDGVGANPEPGLVQSGELEFNNDPEPDPDDEIDDDFAPEPERSSESQAAALAKLRKARGKKKP